MSSCVLLQMIKSRIDAGENPEDVIPYSLPSEIDQDDYIELLFYAKQVLTNGRRKDSISKSLEEILNVSRRDSQL